MDVFLASALAVLVIFLLVAMWVYFSNKKNDGTSWSPVAPATMDVNHPPPNIYIEGKVKANPGERWPDPASAGCSGNDNYGLITTLCGRGGDPGLIGGGYLKCTNRGNTEWTGCRQATKHQ